MVKMKLESVDVAYDIQFDRMNVCEHYVPVGEDEAGELLVVGDDATSARRVVTMTKTDFERITPKWRVAGVKVRNSAGEEMRL